MFRVSGLELEVWGFGFEVGCFGLGNSVYGFRVTGFRIRVSIYMFPVSGFGCEVWDFGFRV